MNFKLSEILKNNDIALAIGLVTIIAMMVIPLPPVLLDLLLTLNISFSVIIMLVCLYTKEPLDYSSFPTVLLIATLFRLGLNISSTRLILLEGQAGNVINSFGEFVVGGNYVVGFVIFIILVIINFMVITGGATRVAEVSARFVLDSLPGKQMAVDADLNSGLINDEQATERRKKIAQEVDFYGTMDGASKFVKGDATAGIIITVINIVGGFIIGIWQLKMDLLTALSTYTILTVGDGLVSQIPALLISTATGLIISRASGRDTSLSEDLKKEMFSDPKVLAVVSGLLFFLGLVPGMPTIPFFAIGMLIGCLAYFKHNERIQKEELEKQQAAATAKQEKQGKRRKKATKESVMELLNVETIEIEVGYRLVPLLNIEKGGDLLERIAQIRYQTAIELGIVLPSIRVRDNLQLSPNTYQIKLKGIAIESGVIYPEKSLAMNSTGSAEGTPIQGISAIEPAFGLPALWIDEQDKENAEIYGFTVVSPSAVISTHLTEVIRRNASDILSRSDVQQLIDNLKKEVSEEYVQDVMEGLSVSDVQQVMQKLLKERVPVKDLKTILETLNINKGVDGKNHDFLTEQVRHALSRTICKQNLTEDGELLVITLAPELENVIAKGVTPDRANLVLDPNIAQQLNTSIETELQRVISTTGNQPVIMCSAPIRMPFRKFLERKYPQISLMSYNELSAETKAKSIGIISVN